jgi:hypothetical protein
MLNNIFYLLSYFLFKKKLSESNYIKHYLLLIDRGLILNVCDQLKLIIILLKKEKYKVAYKILLYKIAYDQVFCDIMNDLKILSLSNLDIELSNDFEVLKPSLICIIESLKPYLKQFQIYFPEKVKLSKTDTIGKVLNSDINEIKLNWDYHNKSELISRLECLVKTYGILFMSNVDIEIISGEDIEFYDYTRLAIYYITVIDKLKVFTKKLLAKLDIYFDLKTTHDNIALFKDETVKGSEYKCVFESL